MSTLGDRIQKIANEEFDGNLSELAKSLSMNYTYLSHVKTGRRDLPKKYDEALESLGYSPSWVRYGEGEMILSGSRKTHGKIIPQIATLPGAIAVRPIPVLGRVPAGFPEDIHNEDIKDYIYVPNAPKNSFALVVQGQSMSGSNIQHGDYVIYIPVSDIRPGDVVIALNEFGAVMVKEYRIKDGSPWLVSTNPEFPSFPVNHAYKVVGKVIDVIRRIKV